MSQYNEGSVSITGGTNVVTGVGTSWLNPEPLVGQAVTPGMMFKVLADDLVFYEITNVYLDGSDEKLELNVNYPDTVVEAAYIVCRDFTPNLSLPLVKTGDLDAADVISRALQMLDQAAYFGFIWKGIIHGIYDNETDIPSGEPLDEYLYLIGTPATGDVWEGHEHDLVVYDDDLSDPWIYENAADRFMVFNLADGKIYIYFTNVGWQVFNFFGAGLDERYLKINHTNGPINDAYEEIDSDKDNWVPESNEAFLCIGPNPDEPRIITGMIDSHKFRIIFNGGNSVVRLPISSSASLSKNRWYNYSGDEVLQSGGVAFCYRMESGDFSPSDGRWFTVIHNPTDVVLNPSSPMMPLGMSVDPSFPNTGTVEANGRCVYIGKAIRDLTGGFAVKYNVSMAQSGQSWSEIAFMKGQMLPTGNAQLTLIGFTDVLTQNSTTGIKTVGVALIGSIQKGDGIWVCFAESADVGTNTDFSGMTPDALQTGVAQRSTGRPSVDFATPETMTLAGALDLMPYCAVYM